ncbi:PseG/SpsG family protein [Elusimicrobiota bacterium]
MRAFILSEGGKSIGYGHLTRCIALLQAIKQGGADNKAEFIYSGDAEAEYFIKNQDISGSNLNWIEKYDKFEKMLDLESIVIMDSYLAPKSIYDRISEMLGGKICMIDDFRRIDYPGGIVVNPSVFSDRLDYPENKNIKYLLGNEYIILRKEFWDVPEKHINNKVKNILITFGGMGYTDLMSEIVDMLNNTSGFNCIVVEPEKNRFNAKEMLGLMLKADICISGGGQTTYELARCGVPTIGICFADNQKWNLEGWQAAGFIKYIGWRDDKGLFDKLNEAIKCFLPENERRSRSEIGKSIVDGKGVKRIAGKISEL